MTDGSARGSYERWIRAREIPSASTRSVRLMSRGVSPRGSSRRLSAAADRVAALGPGP
jgi:hypothetical protein